MNPIDFSFSDTIAGYVNNYNASAGEFTMTTSDDRTYTVRLNDAAYAEVVRNLGEPFQSCGSYTDLLVPGRHLFVYGIFYPETEGHVFEVKHLVFLGVAEGEFRPDEPDWWVKQCRGLADFYLQAQFGSSGEFDWNNYRTQLTLEGTQLPTTRQETDTISRLIFGLASTYLLTGEDKYLNAAEKGCAFLRDHLRATPADKDITFWYHAEDRSQGHSRKIFASEFGDDYQAIPMYEQIYALAGITQTYRCNANADLYTDIERTANLFDEYFLDRDKGGYFSHIDPVHFDPHHPSLTHNRSRKNWNSVGDHAPAYLINLYLATGDERWAKMLTDCADTIAEHFPDYENSPFVMEKFFGDWTHDYETPLQKNRAIIGHNLKIAWNLMRIYHLSAKPEYVAFARKIAEIMPTVGMDVQRGGWYDMMERALKPGETKHRLIWHDRKAWWQQEQGILAYLILHGSLKDADYLKYARESVAFYNAFFPDNDSGGVYFNVLGNGIPYLLGTERLKGSHSMSGYHSMELCYLAAVYNNLLITKEPLFLYFKPTPSGLKDGILRVAPDILPAGSVKLEEVWVNNELYHNFDPENLTVTLPMSEIPVRVRVRLVPHETTLDAIVSTEENTSTLTLIGTLATKDEPIFSARLKEIAGLAPETLILDVTDLVEISDTCMNALVFARQLLPQALEIQVVGANEVVRSQIGEADFSEDILFVVLEQ